MLTRRQIFLVDASADRNDQLFIAHLLCECVGSCLFNAKQLHYFCLCYLPAAGDEVKDLSLLGRQYVPFGAGVATLIFGKIILKVFGVTSMRGCALDAPCLT